MIFFFRENILFKFRDRAGKPVCYRHPIERSTDVARVIVFWHWEIAHWSSTSEILPPRHRKRIFDKR